MAPGFQIKMTGYDTLFEYFAAVPEKVRQTQRKVLYEHASKMFEESQIQVPYRKGNLQRSGQVALPPRTGEPSVEIGYGGSAVQYAFEVHERVGANFATKYNNFDPRKKAKYLEDPVLAGIPALRRDLTDRVRKMLSGV